MGTVKIVTSKVEVYYVKGETMEIAFKNFKNEYNLDNSYLHSKNISLSEKEINTGKILDVSKKLFNQYFDGSLSEFAVVGALFNKKPTLKDESRMIQHNIVIKGTKQWVTTNAFTTDGGSVIKREVGTKEDAKKIASELCLEHNTTINVVVSKDLVDSNGVIFIAEFVPADFVDQTDVFVFWKYVVTVAEKDEDENIEEHMDKDEHGQLSIKDTLQDYHKTQLLK